jgi:hypothetical protein
LIEAYFIDLVRKATNSVKMALVAGKLQNQYRDFCQHFMFVLWMKQWISCCSAQRPVSDFQQLAGNRAWTGICMWCQYSAQVLSTRWHISSSVSVVGTARLCYQISKNLLKICQKVAPKFRKVAQKVAQSEKSCSKVALMFLYLQYTFDIISNNIIPHNELVQSEN